MIDFKIGGTVMGDRTIESTGSVVFEDLTNNRKAVIITNTHKASGFFSKKESGKKDEVTGIIYDCEPIQNPDKTAKIYYGKDSKHFGDLKEVKDVKKKLCDVSGSWLEEIKIDGKKYWSIQEHKPSRLIPDTDSMVSPSDWRYREDLLWLKYGSEDLAATWKYKLELK
jgi:hypothetical protein